MDMLSSIFGSTPSATSESMRLMRIERKLDLILDHLGLQDHPNYEIDGLSASLIELLRQGKKLDAIKIYREETGVGLKEAKDAVEALEHQSPK